MSGENIVSTVLNTVTSTVGNTVNALTGGAPKTTVSKLDPARWQGFSHDELYQLLHDGPGPTASALPTQRWTEIAGTLADVDADLRGALNRSADGWRGSAASMAYERLSTLANWADSAGQGATAMLDATQRQADNIAKARADMPAPTKVPPVSPDPTAAPAMQVLSLQGDQETPDAAASAGEQSAHDVMTTYQLNTESTVEALGTFIAPERVAAPVVDSHGHSHGHGILGLTSPSGLLDGVIGAVTGHHESPGNNGHHGGYSGGGGTSSSGSGWGGGGGSGGYSPPETSGGGRPPGGGYSPLLPGFGFDEDENRRSNNVPGRTSMPGTSGPVSGVGGPGGSFNATTGGLNGAGSFNGVLGGPNSALPNSAGPGAHGITSANPASAALNPAEMPPPAAAAAGPGNTMTSGATGGAGVGAGVGHGGADRFLGRRGFEGMGAGTGNGSWLAEPEPAMPSSVSSGSTPRRRDFKAQVRVTEKVTVDGKSVDLPERVIGGRRDEDEDR